MRNHSKVTSMNNVTPIRAEVAISHAGVGSFAPVSYTQESVWCRRYEDNICRVCGETRLPMSPWCPNHFPWWREALNPSGEEDTKEPKSVY